MAIWFVSDDGFRFVWNKMEQSMKYMRRDLREGLENIIFNREHKMFCYRRIYCSGEWRSVKDVNLCVEEMARDMTYTCVGVPGHK